MIATAQQRMTGSVNERYSDEGNPLKCWRCTRVIAKAHGFHGSVEIKCNRCKAINMFQGEGHCGSQAPDLADIVILLNERWEAQWKNKQIHRAELALGRRFEVFMRDGFRCRYCGQTPEDDGVALHVDHKQPKSKGGSDDLDNLLTSCVECNLGKSDKEI